MDDKLANQTVKILKTRQEYHSSISPVIICPYISSPPYLFTLVKPQRPNTETQDKKHHHFAVQNKNKALFYLCLLLCVFEDLIQSDREKRIILVSVS